MPRLAARCADACRLPVRVLAYLAPVVLATAPGVAQVPDDLPADLRNRLGPYLDDDPSTGPSPNRPSPPVRLLGLPQQPGGLTALTQATAEEAPSPDAAIVPPRRVPPARPPTTGARYALTIAGEPAGEIAVREGTQQAGLWVSLAGLAERGGESAIAVRGRAGFAGGKPQAAPTFHVAATPPRLYRADRPKEARTLPADAILPRGDDLFVTAELANTLLGRRVALDGPAQRVKLAAAPSEDTTGNGYTPPKPPPQPTQGVGADLQLNLEGPWRDSGSRDMPRLWSSATLEGTDGPWSLRGQVSGRSLGGTLGGAATPGLSEAGAELDRLSLSLGVELPHGARGSASLLPRHLELGDVLPVDGPVAQGAPPERGVAATSLPRHRYPDLRELRLRGPARPGSTVLAFRDGRLVDHNFVGLDGRYSLDPVGLEAGPTQLSRVTVANTGAYRDKTRQLDPTRAQFIPGTADYSFSVTQQGTPLVPTDPAPAAGSLALPGGASAIPAPPRGGVHATGKAMIPVTGKLRADLASEVAEGPNQTRAAHRLNLTQIFAGGLADGSLVAGPESRLGGELGLRLDLAPWRLALRQAYADASRRPGPYGGVVDRPSATTEAQAVWRNSSRVTESVALDWQRRRRGPAVTNQLRFATGTAADGERFSTELRLGLGNDAAVDAWRGGAQLALVLPFERSTVLGVIDGRLAQTSPSGAAGYGALHRRFPGGFGGALLARVKRQPRAVREAGARVSWGAGGLRTALQLSRTGRAVTRLGLSVTARLGAPPGAAENRTTREPELDRSAVRAQLRYGAGAAPPGRRPQSPVVGARATAEDLPASGRTGRRGQALLTDLPPGERVRVRVDERSLDLPQRQRARPAHRDARAAIGEEPILRFRVEANGTVSGTLRLRRRSGEAVPAAGLPVVLRPRGPASGSQRVHTGNDGSFSFDGVPPGRYTVGVGRATTRQLGYRPGLRKPVTLERLGASAGNQTIFLGPPGGTEGKRGPAPREIGSQPAVAVNEQGQPGQGDPAAQPDGGAEPDASLRDDATRSSGAAQPGSISGVPGGAGAGASSGSSPGGGSAARGGQQPAPQQRTGQSGPVLFLGDYPDASARTVAWFGLKQRFNEALANVQQLPPEQARNAVGAQALPQGAQAPLYAGPVESRQRGRQICQQLEQARQFCSLRPAGERG